MSRFLLVTLLLSVMVAPQAGEFSQTLNAQIWAQPRDGDTVRRFPALRKVVSALQQDASARLMIRYPGGDEGNLWAHELRGWLVSLGVESHRIELIPGGVEATSVLLTVAGEQIQTPAAELVTEPQPVVIPSPAVLTERRNPQ